MQSTEQRAATVRAGCRAWLATAARLGAREHGPVASRAPLRTRASAVVAPTHMEQAS